MFWTLPVEVRAGIWRHARFQQGRAVVAAMLAARRPCGTVGSTVWCFCCSCRVPLVFGTELAIAPGKTLKLTACCTPSMCFTVVVTDRSRIRVQLFARPQDTSANLHLTYSSDHWQTIVIDRVWLTKHWRERHYYRQARAVAGITHVRTSLR